jgi:hypothetical protein
MNKEDLIAFRFNKKNNEVRYDFDKDLDNLYIRLEEIKKLKKKGCYCCNFKDQKKMLYESDAFTIEKCYIAPHIKATSDPFKSDLIYKSEKVKESHENFMISSHLIKKKKDEVKEERTTNPRPILKSRGENMISICILYIENLHFSRSNVDLSGSLRIVSLK